MHAVAQGQLELSTISNLQTSYETAIAVGAPNWKEVVAAYMADTNNHCSEAQPRTARPQAAHYALKDVYVYVYA